MKICFPVLVLLPHLACYMEKTTSSPLTGTIIRNNVRIGVQLGRGAMGDVYLAEETHLRRSVAVKVIRESVVGDRRFTRAFLNEARIISQLRHPNIVSLMDFGKTREGRLFLIMEYIPGKPLSRACALDGTEDPKRIINLLAQVADALEVAHQAGVVHRDIKPDNILIEEISPGRELAKLLDFGLAHQSVGMTDAITKGKVVGAPAFMSPEQSRAKHVTARSDVFSLGAVLMLLIAGRRIYEGSTVRKVLRNATMGKVLDPFVIRPALHNNQVLTKLGNVCKRATSPDPNERYEDAKQMAQALRACLSEQPAAWGALPNYAKTKQNDKTIKTLKDETFDEALRGRGHTVQVQISRSRSIKALRHNISELASRRGMAMFAPPQPVSACHVGEIIAYCITNLINMEREGNHAWSSSIRQILEDATLLKRYFDGWQYEATHPILFEASDSGLVMALRELLVTLSRIVPIAFLVELPQLPDQGLFSLLHALHTLQGTHAIMVILATHTTITELSIPITSFDASWFSASNTFMSFPLDEPALMIELTQEILEAASQGDINTVDELLIEVNGAVPTEYLGDTAYRVYAIVIESLPKAVLTHPTPKGWLFEAIRAAIRFGDLRHAKRWISLLDGTYSSPDDMLQLLSLKTRIAHLGRKDLTTVELMSELRIELLTSHTSLHTTLAGFRDLCHVARKHGFTARIKTQVCPRLIGIVAQIVNDPLSPSPLIHRGLEALLLVVRYVDDIRRRQRTLKIIDQILERTLPARLELEARMALIHEEYLIRGMLSDASVDRSLERARLLAERIGALNETYKLHRLSADVAIKREQSADASRELYQALRISEAIHWPNRLADTLAKLKSLTSMDAVGSVR